MFKPAAIKTTLVHLLVVLSLVIESKQWPFDSPADQKKWLLKRLTPTEELSPESTLGYLNKVKSKREVTIGGTNVEKLLELNGVKSANCRDGSYAKRLDICEQAKSERIYPIINYCMSKLSELTNLCLREGTSNEAKPTDAPIDQVTVDFFKSLFKDNGSRKLDGPVMNLLLDGVYFYHGGWRPMKNHCLVLKNSGKQSGTIVDKPAKQSDRNQLETDSEQPMWSHAYDICKYYFDHLDHYNDYKNSVFYRPSVGIAL